MALNLFRRKQAAPEAKASAALRATAGVRHGAARPVWTPRDTVSLTRSGYGANVVGFRCVRMIAEAAAAVPFRLIEGGRALSEHPAEALLRRPSPAQDGAALLEAVYGHLQLHGDAYLEAAAPEGEAAPTELHALRPDRMRVIAGPDGWPEAYEYRVGARAFRFEMDEPAPILHLRAFHPLDDHYGMSPMEAAAASLDVHNASSEWAKALLDNAARPSGAVVFRGEAGETLTEEQFARLKTELEAHHQGARNAGRPILLEGGLDWKPMGHSPREMEFLETRSAAAREIALAFGVPPMLLGLPGDATYANYQEANRAFHRQTVAPLARRLAGALSAWLGTRWGGALRFEPDFDRTPAGALEREALWRRVGEADFLSVEEKREMLGLPPRRNG